eukprot:scaffold28659_cov18-Tisochrysis_lutea.AAC.1
MLLFLLELKPLFPWKNPAGAQRVSQHQEENGKGTSTDGALASEQIAHADLLRQYKQRKEANAAASITDGQKEKYRAGYERTGGPQSPEWSQQLGLRSFSPISSHHLEQRRKGRLLQAILSLLACDGLVESMKGKRGKGCRREGAVPSAGMCRMPQNFSEGLPNWGGDGFRRRAASLGTPHALT